MDHVKGEDLVLFGIISHRLVRIQQVKGQRARAPSIKKQSHTERERERKSGFKVFIFHFPTLFFIYIYFQLTG